VASKPAGRGNPRTRANRARTADQWLELPGWRRPLDAVFVFALVAGIAWLVLVTIPAAANRSPEAALADEGTSTTSEDADREAVQDEAEAPVDDDQWVAGPVYNGPPPAPEPQAVVPVENAAGARPAVAGASSRGAARVTPSRTAAKTSARTTAPAPPAGSVPTVTTPPADSSPTVAAGTSTPPVETSSGGPTTTSTAPTSTTTTTSSTSASETTSTETATPTSTGTSTP